MTGRKTAVKRKVSRSASGGRAKVSASSAPVEDAEARWRREERYRSVVNVMSEGMVLQTAEGTIIDCNEQATRILGQPRNRILGRTSRDPHWRAVREDGSPFPGEEHPAMIALKTGQSCRQVVMGLHLPKGVLRWININAEPLFWNRKIKPDAVVVTFSDITERKRIEASLRESNALLSLFMQHSPIYAYIKEVTPAVSRVLMASDNFREMVGIPGSAMQNKTMTELFPAEFAAKITRDDQAVLAKGEVLKLDEELNGRHYATVKFPIVQDGRSLLAGYTIDITERKHAEEALRKSKERFRAIADFSPDIISIFDREGRLVFNSAAASKIHGYQPGELENRSTFDFIHPDDRLGVTATFGRLLMGQEVEAKVQYRYRNADGSYKWMEAIGRNELNNPHINGIIAISRDITERKRSELILHDTAERLSLAQQAGRVGIFDWNLVTNDAVWTPELEEIFGLLPGSFEKRYEGWRKRVHPDDLPRIEAMFAQWLKSKKEKEQWEYRYRRHDEWRWISARGQVFRGGSDKPLRMVGTNVDITDRKQAELELLQLNETLELRVGERTAALRESEERFRAIATNTPDHILIQDRELRYQLVVNPQLGFTEADMIGKTDRDLFNQADAERLTALKQRVLKTGKPVRMETPFPNLKGELEYFEGVYTPKRDAEGRVDGLIGYFRNVTERVRLEQEILNISEWERRRIAQDLHDGLGQLLVGAGFLADTLRKDLAKMPNFAARRLSRIQDAISAAGKQAREVARGVQPVAPEPAGLMTALAKLAEQTSEMFRIRCDLRCPRPVSVEDCQTGIHLFRIAQESVTNAIKHGRAKRIALRLTRTPTQITLAIKDDGAGLDQSRQKKTGMGLHIMRHRAGIIGGTLTIKNKSIGGAIVTCSVPISDKKNRQATGRKD